MFNFLLSPWLCYPARPEQSSGEGGPAPLPGPARPRRYLDLAVEEAGALHDLLRGHLQHLLADAVLRGHNGSVTLGPARGSPRPRRPRPLTSDSSHTDAIFPPARGGALGAADSERQIPHCGFPAARGGDSAPGGTCGPGPPRTLPCPDSCRRHPDRGLRRPGRAESAGGTGSGRRVTCLPQTC